MLGYSLKQFAKVVLIMYECELVFPACYTTCTCTCAVYNQGDAVCVNCCLMAGNYSRRTGTYMYVCTCVYNTCMCSNTSPYLWLLYSTYIYGVEAAKRDLTYIPGRSIKVHACNKNVRIIKNSGPCNSMIDGQGNFQCVRKKL